MVGTIVNHNNRSALMLRKIFVNREIIKRLVLEILRKGTFEFNGEIVFINKEKAIERLKQAELI